MKCYIAGPLFTEGDRWYLEKIDKECERLDIVTYLPHRDAGLCASCEIDTKYFFDTDFQNIIDSDFIIAVLHGTDIDSGTAWEIGCAYAKNKKIFSIAEDIRIAGIEGNINLMISNSSQVAYTFSQLVDNVEEYVRNKK